MKWQRDVLFISNELGWKKVLCAERLMTNVHGSMNNERYRREGNSQMENGGNL